MFTSIIINFLILIFVYCLHNDDVGYNVALLVAMYLSLVNIHVSFHFVVICLQHVSLLSNT